MKILKAISNGIYKVFSLIPNKTVKVLVWVLIAAISAGGFISKNSAWADAKHLNGWCNVVAYVFGFIAIAIFAVAASESNADAKQAEIDSKKQ